MVTISNSSPLILYASIGRLELLHRLFGELIVPASVYDEVVVKGAEKPGAAAVVASPWIRTRAAADRQMVGTLQQQVDPGEAEAIALAIEIGEQAVVLIDDRKGRRLARERDFEMVGSAGVLLLAKERGLISRVGPLLDELRAAGLRLSDRAYREVLLDAGEPPDD
ncbi:MAG TPA: DUF3368 domain-containing protein [Chloroflexota bacterium]|nr:DUF3368 domain-containing protein [Chloroflexota bacterium]